jgi:ABC-2 type transport system ATP-binding protein
VSWLVRDITVRFGTTLALSRVSLDIERGRLQAVIGGDGAGKSTLLEILAGLDLGQTGSARLPAPGRIGFVPSGGGVFGDLTVAENVEFVADVHRLRDWRGWSEELLERAAIGRFSGRLARRLSGGQRRKLAGCLALLPRPDLLVLDEATTGVDPVSRMELWRLVSSAASDGAAVVASTSYLDEAERMESVVLLHEGRILASGAPNEIIDEIPGMILDVERPTARATAWRSGRRWHQWVPESSADAEPIRPSLEDAAIVLELGESAGDPPIMDPAGPGPRPRRNHLSEGAAGSVVTAHGVTRRFGDFTAVDGMDLDVAPGEIVGLLGANGAGKTTLIRMVLGLLDPTEGAIRLFGERHSRQQRRRIGYVPQNLGLYADLTAAENLAFRAAVFGALPIGPTVTSWTDSSGALDSGALASGSRGSGAVEPSDDEGADATDLVGVLPLGVQRRIALDAAIQHRPELLVLDEPTSGVSPLARSRLWDLIHGQSEQGVAVLVSTHYMDEAEQADRLLVMSRGRMVATGTATEIIGDRTTVEVAAERWADAFAALDRPERHLRLAGRNVRVLGESADQVAGLLARAGIEATTKSVPATLEEVLIELDGAQDLGSDHLTGSTTR